MNEPNVDTWTPPETIDPGVFAANKNEHKESTHTIKTSSGTNVVAKGFEYTLKQPRHALEAICENKTARSWIMDAVENPSCEAEGVYLVVGLRTLVDSNLGVGSSQIMKTAVQAEAPVGQAIGAPAVGDALDVSLEAGHRSESSLAEQLALPGEQIHEIYYRKLKFSFWNPKDNPKLGKKCWKLFATNNSGSVDEDDGEDDEILEVDLEDEDAGDAVEVSGADLED
ncbi:hypothetical protein P280DRAFT_514606 [Massarina eburnea CBS 473.64]|uniref:Uncharacterized protein n=1 Tax=Massarina eburnea CBS 473.64 TaxID=1395130 RepID=A0A6A6SBC4_9PLEO|nr:hypothetical protein P280DRAFT_514606 [Massarina eburnea CBS 473.64]